MTKLTWNDLKNLTWGELSQSGLKWEDLDKDLLDFAICIEKNNYNLPDKFIKKIDLLVAELIDTYDNISDDKYHPKEQMSLKDKINLICTILTLISNLIGINSNSDIINRYNEIKSEINQLKIEINNDIDIEFNIEINNPTNSNNK